MNEISARILVVDDEADACANLADILGDLGYGVDTACDGYRALELVRHTAYDVAFLDLRMPEMDGLTLYRELKQLSPQTVAVIVTAYGNHETAALAQKAGAWKVLPKPVDLPAMLQLVEQATRQPLVLVVDDDDALCLSLQDLLQDRGYRVGIAHSQSQLLHRLQQRDYQVLLLDVRLPDGGSLETLQRARSLDPELPVVLMTGLGAERGPEVAQLLAAGADAVCYKPFDMEYLLTTLQRLSLQSLS